MSMGPKRLHIKVAFICFKNIFDIACYNILDQYTFIHDYVHVHLIMLPLCRIMSVWFCYLEHPCSILISRSSHIGTRVGQADTGWPSANLELCNIDYRGWHCRET